MRASGGKHASFRTESPHVADGKGRDRGRNLLLLNFHKSALDKKIGMFFLEDCRLVYIFVMLCPVPRVEMVKMEILMKKKHPQDERDAFNRYTLHI